MERDSQTEDICYLSTENSSDFDPTLDWQEGDAIPRFVLRPPSDSPGPSCDPRRFSYAEVAHDFIVQHYGFLLSESEFDAVLERYEDLGIEYGADSARRRPMEYDTSNCGRGVYVPDPSGHTMEVLTRTEL